MSTLQLQRLHRHDCSTFACGEPRIDAWLQQRAARHSQEGLSITHVLVDTDGGPATPIGFYTLAPATVQPVDAPPAAAIRMSRLAVARHAQGRGHGRLLLAAAVARCLQMRNGLGIRALIADVLNAGAARFYREHGFRPIAGNAMTLYLPLSAVRADAQPGNEADANTGAGTAP